MLRPVLLGCVAIIVPSIAHAAPLTITVNAVFELQFGSDVFDLDGAAGALTLQYDTDSAPFQTITTATVIASDFSLDSASLTVTNRPTAADETVSYSQDIRVFDFFSATGADAIVLSFGGVLGGSLSGLDVGFFEWRFSPGFFPGSGVAPGLPHFDHTDVVAFSNSTWRDSATGANRYFFNVSSIQYEATAIPEPSTVALLLSGFGLVWIRRSRRTGTDC